MPVRLRLRHRNAGPAAEGLPGLGQRRLREDLRIGEELRAGPPPVRGHRVITATLPKGRVLWLRLPAPITPLAETNRAFDELRRQTDRREAELRRRQADLVRLSRSTIEDAKRLVTARHHAQRKLGRRIVALTSRLDRRLSRKFAKRTAEIEQQAAWHSTAVDRLRRRVLWDNLVLTSALPLAAAFGQRGKILGTNNIALAILTAIWIVGDNITDFLARTKPDPRYGIRDTDFWSYIAPFANLLAGWLLLQSTQSQRFVSGFADDLKPLAATTETINGVDEQIYRFEQRIKLRKVVAADHFPDFEGFTNVPAVASAVAVAFTDDARLGGARLPRVSALVDGRKLVITATVMIPAPPSGLLRDPTQILDKLNIAWIVDTDKHAEA